jgi:hypothetical protein
MSRVAMTVIADAGGRAAVWPKIGVDDPYVPFNDQFCSGAQRRFGSPTM